MEVQYIRRHHNYQPNDNQCFSSLVKHIKAPVDLVWSLVRKFDQPQKYKPFVSRCIVQGEVNVGSLRQVNVKSGLPATTSTERLELLDDDEHILGIRIIGGDHRLKENSKVSENTSHRNFGNPVLAYITPWNSRGYENAKRFNSRFTHLSPVWYDLKSQGTKLILEGRHNADRGWISELRMKGNAKVLPRVVLEAFPNELLKKKKQRNKAIDLIVTECKEMEYDGIVLESWSRWAGYGVLHDPAMRNMALQFVKQLGQELHAVSLEGNSKQCLQLVYVIGPPYSEKLQEHDFGPEDLRSLSDAVDGFSLMTYDFSSPQHPGPNAPLKWIRSTLELLLGTTSNGARSLAHKIFVGMNFYGNDFVLSEGLGGGAITGRDYLALLEKHKPSLQWDENSAEHFFVYSDNQNIRHAVFYPTPMSISIRLEEARSWGAGLSIWEIGQGLDYFFDIM